MKSYFGALVKGEVATFWFAVVVMQPFSDEMVRSTISMLTHMHVQNNQLAAGCVGDGCYTVQRVRIAPEALRVV